MPSKRDRKRGANKPKQDVEAKHKARAKSDTKARSRTRSKHDEDTSEASLVHIDELLEDRGNPRASPADKSKTPKRRKPKTLHDVETATRVGEDPYGIGHRQDVTVGSGKASKSRNI